MFKKIITSFISLITIIFLLSSCGYDFYRKGFVPMHSRGYFDFSMIFGPHFRFIGILDFIIKILIIIALIFLIKFLYNKDRNTKKDDK